MSLTSPIPDAARPIVEAIRAEVPRPRWEDFKSLSIYPGHPKFRIDRKCPMGMLPCAKKDAPWSGDQFTNPLRFPDSAVAAFLGFWELQADIKAAVQAVWAEEKP